MDVRPLRERSFDRPFPLKTIVTPLYINYPHFEALPKPGRFKAFFVMRDPRDIVVSAYFSFKHSHRPNERLAQVRTYLGEVDQTEGMRYLIEYLGERGLFDALRSWRQPLPDNAIVVRYEDLISADQHACFQKLFRHCDIELPDSALRHVLARNSIEARTGGRKAGQEDIHSHVRKGIAGDWRNHFNPTLERAFRETTGDLIDALGYQW